MLQRLCQRAQWEFTFKLPSAANLLQKYAFLLKDARNYWKMFEAEGDNKKSKEKRLFCCHYQNIYVLLQKQKTRGHHQHRIIWERALPGLRCKDTLFFWKKQGFIGKCLRVREIKRKRCVPLARYVGQEGYTLLYIWERYVRLLTLQSSWSCFHTSG